MPLSPQHNATLLKGNKTPKGRARTHAETESAFHCCVQCPELEFRFVFFPLQMLRFSALSGPNEQTFGELF